jgi:hypothetical protein
MCGQLVPLLRMDASSDNRPAPPAGVDLGQTISAGVRAILVAVDVLCRMPGDALAAAGLA